MVIINPAILNPILLLPNIAIKKPVRLKMNAKTMSIAHGGNQKKTAPIILSTKPATPMPLLLFFIELFLFTRY